MVRLIATIHNNVDHSKAIKFFVIELCARRVITFYVKKSLHFALNTSLHFALMLFDFILRWVLHLRKNYILRRLLHFLRRNSVSMGLSLRWRPS